MLKNKNNINKNKKIQKNSTFIFLVLKITKQSEISLINVNFLVTTQN